jgi:capsular polysaccharide biosynthesis protein
MYVVNELVVPTYPDPPRESCKWLKHSVAKNVLGQGKKGNRIYISREQANRRRIANRDEIQGILEEFGFESYILENLSVSEQIRLFSTAEIIISPHGAGLVNMIYAEDPVIIELFGCSKKATFYRLAKILGYNYRYVHGENKGADININKHKLQKIITTVVSQSAPGG